MTNAAEYYLEQGISKHKIGDYAGAIEDLDIAIDIVPSFALSYYYRAVHKGLKQFYYERFTKN